MIWPCFLIMEQIFLKIIEVISETSLKFFQSTKVSNKQALKKLQQFECRFKPALEYFMSSSVFKIQLNFRLFF